jgi:hypothetical protein
MQNGKFSELHHTTIHDWIIDFRQLPIFDNVPESRQHFDVWNFQPTISAWVEENKQLPIFYQPPESRQHFDVWNFQKPCLAGLVKANGFGIYQATVSRWLKDMQNGQLPILHQPPGLPNLEQIPNLVARPNLANTSTCGISAALIYSFIYSPDIL